MPSSVTDANNNTTEFTYDPVHRGVLTATGPAPSPGAARPVKRYTYAQRYAWIKNAAGAYVQAASPIWMLVGEKICRTSATVGDACAAGATDEVTVSYDYGPSAGPNNLWLRGKIVTADGVSLRTCFSYDQIGNKISETSPRAGLTSCP
jgi:YD repeat-containing protein